MSHVTCNYYYYDSAYEVFTTHLIHVHVHCRYICICPLCLDISDLSVEPYPQPKPLPNSTDFAAFLKGDLEYEFVRLMQILDRRGQAHQHISQTY